MDEEYGLFNSETHTFERRENFLIGADLRPRSEEYLNSYVKRRLSIMQNKPYVPGIRIRGDRPQLDNVFWGQLNNLEGFSEERRYRIITLRAATDLEGHHRSHRELAAEKQRLRYRAADCDVRCMD